jgi:hypothetical protein
LPRLAGSRREAAVVAALVAPADRLVALGHQASRDLVQGGGLADFRIVHFATHGVFGGGHPALAGLQLSRFDAADRPVDGLLWQRAEHWHRQAEELGRPQVNTPILRLSPARSPAVLEPDTVLVRGGEGSGWFVLELEIGGSLAERYRVTLAGSGGEARWHSDRLVPVGEVLVVSLPSRFLVPGDYRLVVEPRRTDAPAEPPVSFPFRVVTGSP